LAKVSPHVLDPVRFALHLAVHLLAQYGHLTGVFVTVEQLRWARIGTAAAAKGAADEAEAAATGHNRHAFWRIGAEKPFVEVELAHEGDSTVAWVAAGLHDLLGAQTWLYFYVLSGGFTHSQTPPLHQNGWYFYGACRDWCHFSIST
jgi:urate oxidase